MQSIEGTGCVTLLDKLENGEDEMSYVGTSRPLCLAQHKALLWSCEYFHKWLSAEPQEATLGSIDFAINILSKVYCITLIPSYTMNSLLKHVPFTLFGPT